MTPGRWLAVAVVAAALLFALAGGEYGVLDHRDLRQRVVAESLAIGVLEREVDSLRAELKAIETDPAVQERIARENYGMLRPGEYMYLIEREPPREP